MASPCIRDTPSTTMTQDGSGDVGVDVVLHPPDSGLGIVADGLYVNNAANGGIYRTVNGLFSRQFYGHVGWTRGTNDVQSPGTAVGAGGYVMVNPILSTTIQRQGALTQYVHVTCGAEMGMGLADPTGQNIFYGWGVGLELYYDFSPTWLEVCGQTMGGFSNGFFHQLRGDDWLVLTDDVVHTVYMRMVIRGGANGTAVCSQTQKRWIHVDYH